MQPESPSDAESPAVRLKKLASLRLAETVQTLVLAGGMEEPHHSMGPMTKRRAKSAIPFGGAYRLIDIPLSNIIRCGLTQIYVLTQFNSRSLNSHIVEAYPSASGVPLSKGVFVEVLCATQTPTRTEWAKGSADAVQSVLYNLPKSDPSTTVDKVKDILVLSGEHLYNMDYADLIRQHRETDADITISCVGVSRTNKALFGVDGTGLGLVTLGEDLRVQRFTEKPSISQLKELADTSAGATKELPYVASMGLYVFKADVLRKLLMNPELVDFGKHVIPHMMQQKMNVKGYVFKGYWEDISTLRSFLDANLLLAKRNSPFQLHVMAPVTAARILPPTKLIGTCKVEESLIAEGCFVKNSTIVRSVLGLGTRVGSGCIIEDSYIMGAKQEYCRTIEYTIDDLEDESGCMDPDIIGIGKGSILRNCVVDKNASIGEGCYLINKDNIQEGGSEAQGYYIRSGVINVLKEAIIPDGTVI